MLARVTGMGATCQCSKWRQRPCTGAITREDLQCDICRAGCSLIMIGGEGAPPGMVFHGGPIEFEPAAGPGGLSADELVLGLPPVPVSFTAEAVAIDPVLYGQGELPAA